MPNGVHITVDKDGRVKDDNGYTDLLWTNWSVALGLTDDSGKLKTGLKGTLIFVPD